MSKVSHGWFVINITNYYSSYSKIHCFINHLICIWTFKKKLFLEIQPFNSFQQRFFKFLYGEVLLETLSSRREAWAFNELGRYHTRPSQFNWGPENGYFGKTHFRDPNINARIFWLIEKRPKKRSEVQQMPKNDQTVIPTFLTSHIRNFV